MKLIFMGTPEFAVPSLARLLSDGHEIVAVFTQPDKPVGRHRELHAPPVKTFALEHGIPVYQPAKIRNNEEVFALFTTLQPDACVVAAYGKILPERLLQIPRLGCINVHASLLPKYRGAAPINWAIANGERETGVTIMQMDAGMDTGGMFAKGVTRIGEDETAAELTVGLSQLGAELLSETLSLIERGELRAEPQNDSEATYAPMLEREDGLIDWQKEATEIANRVRAFQPWPSAYTIHRGGRLIIWRAKATTATEESAAEPAQIVSIDKSGITIACANHTVLQIMEVQPEGKRRMPARDFLNGAHLHIGDRLTDIAG
jgi:methionyl-tRNA formyltransferase